MEEHQPAIEVETGVNPRYSVIWLHGLGADGGDFVPIVPELGLQDSPAVRFVFPHAPYIPVTCNGGYVMRAWYDIISLDSHSRRIDEAGIVASCAAIGALIEREIERGITVDRIFLAGFSQGGAVAYLTGLTHPERLGGIVALSTYIPSPRLLRAELVAEQLKVPIFTAHGDEDDVVAPELGEAARDLLRELGAAPEWRSYPMPHSVCLEEIRDLGQWLSLRLKNTA